MKIILLQDIKNLGKKLDIKEVRDGYGRNFLLPRKMAALATAAALSQRERRLAQEQLFLEKLKAAAEKLAKETLEFHLKTGEAGEVFGSVTADDIKKLLLERGYADFEVNLERPLKSLGEQKVGITFSRGIKGSATIKIV